MAKWIDDRTRPLYRRFMAHTAQPDLAAELAQGLYGTLGQQAEQVAEVFMERGWTGEQIRTLIRRNKTWRHDIDEVFAREEAMMAYGIPSDMTRLMLSSRVLTEEFDLVTIRLAFATLKECHVQDKHMAYAILHHPRTFLQKPKWIADVFAESVQKDWTVNGFIQHLARGPDAVFPRRNGKRKNGEKDEHSEDDDPVWTSWCKKLLSSVGYDVEKRWPGFAAAHAWMKGKTGIEIEALEQLLAWVPFVSGTSGLDDRTLFFAALLLDTDLPRAKRETLKMLEKQEASVDDESQLMESLSLAAMTGYPQTKPPLSTILTTSEVLVSIRFYVLRRIVDLAPETYPELLLIPWENILYPETRFPGKAFPRIPRKDEASEKDWDKLMEEVQLRFEEIKRELHFRVNEIRSRKTGRVKLKRYVALLANPERREFLELLASPQTTRPAT